MITLDGASGEGGGQILRSALTLSLLTGRAFELRCIRANRDKPGLRPQHLTCVLAAARIGSAQVAGAQVDSSAITFEPGPVAAGRYHFETGTAGATALVLQTVFLPLALAAGPSVVEVTGGTHNNRAPSVDYLQAVFFPAIATTGLPGHIELLRHGFYPRGGGRARLSIEPARDLVPLALSERGPVSEIRARVLLAGGLPETIAERELSQAEHLLAPARVRGSIERPESFGPGNALVIETRSALIAEQFTAVGSRGVRAEDVAREAAEEARAYLNGDWPVGPHLADQLLLPLALAGGEFRTGPVTAHFTTNIGVIEAFLGPGRLSVIATGAGTRVLCDRPWHSAAGAS